MRFATLVPLCALFGFGCAHEAASTTAENQPESQPAAMTQAEPKPAEPTAEAPITKAQIACSPVKVHFALDSDKLYDSEKPLLDATAKCLNENNKQKVSIVGNTDERGTQAYNMDLGQRRADTVAQYLESQGADPKQVESIVSHGEDSPICDASDLKCWQLNRRTAVRESCHM
jgi:outer membrane protein OmpA-like peptidoglycan-associated protein